MSGATICMFNIKTIKRASNHFHWLSSSATGNENDNVIK